MYSFMNITTQLAFLSKDTCHYACKFEHLEYTVQTRNEVCLLGFIQQQYWIMHCLDVKDRL